MSRNSIYLDRLYETSLYIDIKSGRIYEDFLSFFHFFSLFGSKCQPIFGRIQSPTLEMNFGQNKLLEYYHFPRGSEITRQQQTPEATFYPELSLPFQQTDFSLVVYIGIFLAKKMPIWKNKHEKKINGENVFRAKIEWLYKSVKRSSNNSPSSFITYHL